MESKVPTLKHGYDINESMSFQTKLGYSVSSP